jgi:hypothetical protein
MSTTAERDEIMKLCADNVRNNTALPMLQAQWAQAYAALVMADQLDQFMGAVHNLPNALQDAIWHATRKR